MLPEYAPTVVEDPLLGTALGSLLFLLGLDLGGLRFDFASTGERTVNYRIPGISITCLRRRRALRRSDLFP
jgi:hypothetical protein